MAIRTGLFADPGWCQLYSFGSAAQLTKLSFRLKPHQLQRRSRCRLGSPGHLPGHDAECRVHSRSHSRRCVHLSAGQWGVWQSRPPTVASGLHIAISLPRRHPQGPWAPSTTRICSLLAQLRYLGLSFVGRFRIPAQHASARFRSLVCKFPPVFEAHRRGHVDPGSAIRPSPSAWPGHRGFRTATAIRSTNVGSLATALPRVCYVSGSSCAAGGRSAELAVVLGVHDIL